MTNENCIQDEIKSVSNLGNACYNSVQDILSSRLLSKNTIIKMCRTTVLSVVLYGWGTWSLTLMEKCRLVFIVVTFIWHCYRLS